MTTPEPTVDLTHLDFQPECSAQSCTNPAALSVMTRCCGVVYLACLACRAYSREKVARMDGALECKLCKKPVITWGLYVFEEAL